MPTIRFFLQSEKNPSGIYIRVRDGQSIDAKARTKFLVNPKNWNNENGRVKNAKDEGMKVLNASLEELKLEVLKAFNSAVKETSINSEWLKSVIDPQKFNAIPLYLVEYFEFYREKQNHNLTKSSYNKLTVVKNFLCRLEQSIRKKILISEVNEDFMQAYLSKGLKEHYSQNYLSRNFTYIKTICYDAEKRGLIISSQLRNLKIKEKPVTKVYLTPSELDAIQKIELDRPALSNARDWLIISCETAQRVSDFLGYKKDNIHFIKNEKGNHIPFLEIIQKKTKLPLPIPLSSKVMQILERNGGDFPYKISAQKYNLYIKEVAKVAGLTNLVDGEKQDAQTKRKSKGQFPKWELVTSHIGRRTYATNNFGIIPTALIMTMTGHKTEKEFLKYIGKSETSMALQLAEYVK